MKLIIKSFLGLAVGLLVSGAALAQVQVNVNVGPPAWGPAVGPDVEYYYIPEIDGYYDLYARQYVFLSNGYWVNSPYLPSVYAGYDPRYFHPVVVDYIGRRPWERISYHRAYSVRYGWTPGRYVVPGRPVYPGRQPYYNGGRPGGYDQRYQSYNPGPGRGYGNDGRYDNNRAGYTDNRGYDNNRGGYSDNRGYNNNRGSDNRDYNNRGNDNNRNSDNRNFDNRGSDNRGGDNRGSDNRGSDNGNRGGENDRSGRGRIR